MAATSQEPDVTRGATTQQPRPGREPDHRIDHRAGQKAWQSGTTHGIVVLPVRWKMPLAQPMEAGPLCWQARGPGFESPMLHYFPLNSRLAVNVSECQFLA